MLDSTMDRSVLPGSAKIPDIASHPGDGRKQTRINGNDHPDMVDATIYPPPATAVASTPKSLPPTFYGSFRKDFYIEKNRDINFAAISPVEHYLKSGWKEARDPNPWFSVSGYLNRNLDVAAAGVEPLLHYLEFGRIEGRRWSEFGLLPQEVVGSEFDPEYYLRTYPDIDVASVNPVEHYLVFGWKEGRNPVPWFSSSNYLQSNDDVRREGIEPFFHYLVFGRQEGRLITGASGRSSANQALRDKFPQVYAEFDDEFYALCYPDLAGPGADRFEHFMIHGWVEGRNPAPWFNTKLYLDANSDIKNGQINPFVHYILEGRAEERSVFSAINNGSRALKQSAKSTLVVDKDFRSFADIVFDPPPHAPSRFNPDNLDIHWVIPDFTPGSGGHSTIFRIIYFLEFMGHKNTVWLSHLGPHKTIEDVYDDVVRHFQPLRAEFHLCDDAFFFQTGDAVIATGWQTVAQVSRTVDFLGRFYLVQDYEPAFYPVGGRSLCAELTYGLDLGCLCASSWLADKLRSDFGRWAMPFKLAFDEEIYYSKPKEKKDPSQPFRIAVYARASTARRCVELTMIALEKLAEQNVNIHVTLFAADIEKTQAPYPCTVAGVMTPAELGSLYRESDLGICFSATNYSLVPQEMMACGLPVLELDSESSRAIFPDGVVTLTGPSPDRICDDIERLIRNPHLLEAQREKAGRWIDGLSWPAVANDIYNGICLRLQLLDHKQKSRKAPPLRRSVKASVCIPAYNGGDLLIEVIDMVRQQEAPWPFDIVVVDSQSTDGSVAKIQKMDGVAFHSIPKSEFGHGKTRNLCASLCTGEYIVFLTQDAKPYDKRWLYGMINVMEHFPRAAGAFGRHVAYPDSHILTRIDLEEHFKSFDKMPLSISRAADEGQWKSQSWRQKAHFYSDNNSCMRRSVWEEIPYPDIEFGEDQVWAQKILDAGYERLYVPSAVVYHSHDYDKDDLMRRAFTEAAFFKKYFGYDLYQPDTPFDVQLARMNANDQRRIVTRGLDISLLEQRKLDNRAVLEGRRLGVGSNNLFLNPK